MNTFLGISYLLVAVFSYLCIIHKFCLHISLGILFSRSSPKLFDDVVNCERILTCVGIENPPKPNIVDAVRTRALPNQRLVRTFGIDNAFTTTDDDYRKAFRMNAHRIISDINSEAWEKIVRAAKQMVGERILPCSEIGDRIQLVRLVQAVSLKLSLHIIFNTNPLNLDTETAVIIANSINNLWIESKKHHPSQEIVDLLQRELEEALVEILPRNPLTPKETPMNLILPAYETLWRVVLRCFLEVTFRPDAEPEWRQALVRFLEDPRSKFGIRHPKADEASVEDIVLEALRLYPPTRRVYRTFQTAPKSLVDIFVTKIYPQYKLFTVAADIEACQRKAEFWGERSLEFKPSRWNLLNGKAPRAFMPFGGKKFPCPAKEDFGPKIIGVLVAALVACIDVGEWELLDQQTLANLERPLDSGREAYRGVFLRRVRAVGAAEAMSMSKLIFFPIRRLLGYVGLTQA